VLWKKSFFLFPEKAESGVRVCFRPPTSKEGLCRFLSSAKRIHERPSSSSSCFGGFLFGVYRGGVVVREVGKAKEKAKVDVVMLLVGYHGKEVAQCSC